MPKRREPPTQLFHTLYWTVSIQAIFEKDGKEVEELLKLRCNGKDFNKEINIPRHYKRIDKFVNKHCEKTGYDKLISHKVEIWSPFQIIVDAVTGEKIADYTKNEK
jgi:hypothetical protein